MVLNELKDELISLQEAIREANSDGVKASLAEIDRISKEERKNLDAQLRHYLKNRSYQKALMYLDGTENIPAGRCGGGKSSQ